MVRNVHTDDDFRLWLLLDHTRDAILKVRENELREVGMSSSAANVLDCIQAISTPTPAEISRRILRKSHSVSGLVNRMEKRGLITKVKDLERKNLVRVLITEKGQQAYQQSTKRGTIHRIMSSLSKEECQQLGLCLQKLRSKALRELNRSRL